MHVENKKQAANLRDGLIVSSSFLTTSGQHTALGEQRRIEIEVAEVVEFATGIYVVETFWSLLRKPPGSGAVVREARLSGVDKPGVYVVECETDGLWTRTVECCACTRVQLYARLPPKAETRLQFRSWINEPGRETQDVIAKLESEK